MKGSAHLAMGICAGAITACAVPDNLYGAAFMGGCIIGSILPDIDLATSKIGHLTTPIAILLNKIFGHRGFIHTPICSLLFALLFGAIAHAITPDNAVHVAAGVFFGCMLHLLQDTFTKNGIRWLYPLPFKIHFTNIKSNNPICYLITIALIVLYFVMCDTNPNIANFLIA